MPLCWRCHRTRWHEHGQATLLAYAIENYGGLFWAGKRNVMSWDDLAAAVEAGWQEFDRGLAY